MSLARLTSEIDKKVLYPRQFVHDAIYNYVPKKYAVWATIALKYYMESNPIYEYFGFDFKVPIIAEPELGLNQGTLVEVSTPAIDINNITLDDLDYIDKYTEELEGKGLYLPKQEIPPNNGRVFKPTRRRS